MSKRWQKDWEKFAGLEVSYGVNITFPSGDPTFKNMKLIKRLTAFTLIELLVVISIIAILASLALPAITGALARGQITQAMSNGRQIYIANTQMALDAVTTGDTNLGWPGDIGGSNTSWSTWATAMVPAYMSTNDFSKMLSAPGLVRGTNTAINQASPSSLYVYAVTDASTMETTYITTANYTNGQPLSPVAKPFGDKGFVVFKKGGDGAVFLQAQATNTALLPATNFPTKLN